MRFSLCLVVVSALVAVAFSAKPDLADPSVRLQAIGFNAEVLARLTGESGVFEKEFPNLMVHSSTASHNATQAFGELLRLRALLHALEQRNTAADREVVSQIRAGFSWCEVCTWVVNQIEGDIESDGCDAAEPLFTSVCASIPYVDVVAAECVEVLDWGCGKLASYIASGITSPAQLCNDVFSICSGGSSSAASSSSSS